MLMILENHCKNNMIKLKNILTESTTPDFSAEGRLNRLKSRVQTNMEKDGKDQQEIDVILTLINKAQSSLAKHYVNEWKDQIPKEMPNYPNYAPDRVIWTQQVHIISATKNWIRKVVTDVAPSISWSDKWKLKIAWPLADWEQIDEISRDILYGIRDAVRRGKDAKDLERVWIELGIIYLLDDRDFVEEMFDKLVD
jgi:hypothetical protein